MAKRTRPIDGVQRRYMWRLYPDKHQAAQLHEQAAMCADLWNALLAMIETRYARALTRDGRHISFHCADCARLSGSTVDPLQCAVKLPPQYVVEQMVEPVALSIERAIEEHGRARASSGPRVRLCPAHKLPSEFDLGNWISEPGHRAPSPEGHLLRDCPEWRALSTWTPRRVATNLIGAFAAFFRRVKAGDPRPGYPRYKSRLRDLAIPHRSVSGCRIWRGNAAWHTYHHHNNWSVQLKGVDGPIRAYLHYDGDVTEWMDVDILCRNGRWEASAAVAVRPWRRGGNEAITVRFDLIDGLASVNGVMDTPQELLDAQLLQEQYDEQQSEHDRRWPRGRLLLADDARARQEDRDRLARLAAKIARKRKNALHVWSAAIIRRTSALTILRPPNLKENSESVRGRKRDYGAYAVDAATEINRVALGYAPAAAVAMLEYKAREAGVPCVVIDDAEAPFLERVNLIAAAERERSRAAQKPGSARSKKRRKSNGGGIDEYVLDAGIGVALPSAR